MEQRRCNAYVRLSSARRPVILVEDDSLDLDVIDLSPPGADAFEIVVCSGPHGAETCPLVVNSACPIGRPDVVVSALDASNPWTRSVHAAWALDGVPIARVDGPLSWPAHVGAAIAAIAARDEI